MKKGSVSNGTGSRRGGRGDDEGCFDGLGSFVPTSSWADLCEWEEVVDGWALSICSGEFMS